MGWWRGVVLAVVAAPLLAGCVAIDANVELQRDDQVNYTFHVEMNRSLAQSSMPAGTDLCSLYLMNDEERMPDLVKVEPTQRDDYVGCRVSATDSLEGFRDSRVGRTGFAVAHTDNGFTFRWKPELGDDAPSQIDAFTFAVTFPGEVLEYSGSATVSGTTVTWTDPQDLVGDGGLFARGRDTPSVWDWLRRWGVYGVGALALIGVLVVLVRRRQAAALAPQGAVADASAVDDPASVGVSGWDGSGSGASIEDVTAWAPPPPATRWELPPPEVWAPGADGQGAPYAMPEPVDAGPPPGEPAAFDPWAPGTPGPDTPADPRSPQPPARSPWAPPAGATGGGDPAGWAPHEPG